MPVLAKRLQFDSQLFVLSFLGTLKSVNYKAGTTINQTDCGFAVSPKPISLTVFESGRQVGDGRWASKYLEYQPSNNPETAESVCAHMKMNHEQTFVQLLGWTLSGHTSDNVKLLV